MFLGETWAMRGLWHNGRGAVFEEKRSKSVIHPFLIKHYKGLTINPYQGCSHRCAYCYATYEWSPEFYDKIYAKSNAPQILEKELATWKMSDEHTSELQSRQYLVCRLLLEKKKKKH